MEVSSDSDTQANPPKRRKIITVVEETGCNENPMNRDHGYNTRTGTTLNERAPTQLSALPPVMPMIAGEQPTRQTIADPFIEQPLSSSSTTPSGEQSTDRTATPGGISVSQPSMPSSKFRDSSKSFLNPNRITISILALIEKPKMDDTSSNQLSTAASVEQLNSFLKRIQKLDSGTTQSNSSQYSVPTIVVVPSVEGEELGEFFQNTLSMISLNLMTN